MARISPTRSSKSTSYSRASPAVSVTTADVHSVVLAHQDVGAAIPSEENAAFYFHNFVTWTRMEEVIGLYFSMFDEPWKAHVEGEGGRCGGLFEENYDIKPWVERALEEEFPGPVNWSD
ncbi:MAG: hypothetical protein P8R42_10010 [Candidatus Binatia bacterium]|nr:hypothetical protein [Candidatus Binatia bacterium]